MPGIRIFQKGSVRLWLVGEDGEAKRELARVGDLSGSVDWQRTVETCRVLPGDEGVALELVLEDE